MLYLSNKWSDESSNTSHPTACTDTSPGCGGENLKWLNKNSTGIDFKHNKPLCN